MSSDVVKRFNEPNGGKFNHRHARYEWTVREMREAADVMANKEVHDLKGQRSHRTEKELLRFASNTAEYREITAIIRQAREAAVERAKLDWPEDEEPPRIETDEEFRFRQKRLRYMPIGVLIFIGVLVAGVLATQEGDDYAFSVETVGRSTVAESVEYTDRNGTPIELRSDERSLARRGEVVTELPIGLSNGSYSVTAVADGKISCSIIDRKSGKVVASATDDERVTCSLSK